MLAGKPTAASSRRRAPLTRERVLRAGLALADKGGVESLTMRKLARKLRLESPMSLYNHVAGRDDLLDGMVDIVFGEIELPATGIDWRTAMRGRAISTREALLRHSWAVGRMESRHPGPANLRNHDAVMGCLREAGFAFELAIHAYSVQDAYIYGFALQERDLGLETPESAGRAAQRRAETIADVGQYPYLVEITQRLPETGYDTAVEFVWGLELILDGLERLRVA